MSRELDAKVAELVMGLPIKGLGYYGPPEDGKWEHAKSRRFDTPELAGAAYAAYWDKYHKDRPHGVIERDDLDANLCYWSDGWGPLSIEEYTSDVYSDYSVLVKVRETWDAYDKKEAFWIALDSIWQDRRKAAPTGLPTECILYEPGDYSRAALAALGATP